MAEIITSGSCVTIKCANEHDAKCVREMLIVGLSAYERMNDDCERFAFDRLKRDAENMRKLRGIVNDGGRA